MNVLDYIASETERQSGTVREALGMYGAYHYLRSYTDDGHAMTEGAIKHMARCINGVEDYRRVPAVFSQGMPALHHLQVPRAMHNLVQAIRDSNSESYMQTYVGYSAGFNRADYLTKEFLDIHPFTDGNGRVGSLLWNYMNKTLHDPEPMPYYYGEQ